jgi:hypothetical protein
MAGIHNELKRATDLLRGFRRAVGIVDAGGVERLGETLTPVLDVWARPECSILRGEEMWAGSITAGPVAGQYSCAALSPPTSGNRIIIVDAYIIRAATSATIRVGVDAREAGLSAAAATYSIRDDRITTQVPSALLYGGTAGAPTSPAGYWQDYSISTGAYVRPEFPIVLLPGGRSLCFRYDGAVNLAFYVGCIWRERQLIPGEYRDDVR